MYFFININAYSNSPQVDLSLHVDTLYRLLLFNDGWLKRKYQYPFYSF
jgi:hypothetical protein